jgi:hypothetical protein
MSTIRMVAKVISLILFATPTVVRRLLLVLTTNLIELHDVGHDACYTAVSQSCYNSYTH